MIWQLYHPLPARKDLRLETKLFHIIKSYYNGYAGPNKQKINNGLADRLKKKKVSHIIVGIIARFEIDKRIDVALKIAGK